MLVNPFKNIFISMAFLELEWFLFLCLILHPIGLDRPDP